MATGWVVPRSEKIRYFIIASIVMVGQVVGLLFLGLWLGQRVSWGSSILGATVGGLVGLISGTICLYYMALSFEQKVLTRLGKRQCPRCKHAFKIEETKCPTCELEVEPTTLPPSQE